MKIKTLMVIGAILAPLLITGYAFISQEKSSFIVKLNKASVHGTSTLHEWDSKITELSGTGYYISTREVITYIKDLEIKIPVTSIKSKEGKVMDNKTYDAFSSDKNPNIVFTFASTAVKTDASKSVSMLAAGFLTMAGTKRPITITAKGIILANGDLQISVTHNLKMTDHKMVPPKAVLGTIHVGDAITVYFEVVLMKRKETNAI